MVKGSNIKSILGVVLAGGKSSRMGTDKAKLSFMGKTLLDFQFEKLESILGRENTIVSGNYPHLPHLIDQEIGLGPLGGIVTIINRYLGYDFFLFLPVDMPKISEKALIALINFAESDSSFDCWSYKGFQMPLLIKKPQAPLTVPIKDRSIRFLLEQLKSKTLNHKELSENEFLNTNTLKEWQEVNL